MLTEGYHAGEFLLSEGNGKLSRETVVINTGEKLAAGTVLGKLTGGHYVAYNNTTNNGSEVALAILYDNVDTTTEEKEALVIAREAEVAGDLLTGVDDDAVTDLETRGIIVR